MRQQTEKSPQEQIIAHSTNQPRASSAVNPVKYKILHVMSYHLDWEWTTDQLMGFQEALKDLDVEYKIYEMDTKRKSTEEWKEKAGKEARELVYNWQPDLVYTNDDNAQKYVTRYFVNDKIPFVFGAVNANPADYGFIGGKNITGVLEQEHIVETIELTRNLVPNIKKIAVFFDDDPTWPGVMQRIKQKAALSLPNVEFTDWYFVKTFQEYQEKIKECQSKVDALALLGIHTFKDATGQNVLWQDVLKWTTENSHLPDFSFWKDRVGCGTLCAVYVSGYEQGLAAGRIAKGILSEGNPPNSFKMEPTIKGQPIISLARVKKLGLQVKSKILLSVKVVEKFDWEN
jgi:ABC-type uncharacterized transport system substrate-binding protein